MINIELEEQAQTTMSYSEAFRILKHLKDVAEVAHEEKDFAHENTEICEALQVALSALVDADFRKWRFPDADEYPAEGESVLVTASGHIGDRIFFRHALLTMEYYAEEYGGWYCNEYRNIEDLTIHAWKHLPEAFEEEKGYED